MRAAAIVAIVMRAGLACSACLPCAACGEAPPAVPSSHLVGPNAPNAPSAASAAPSSTLPAASVVAVGPWAADERFRVRIEQIRKNVPVKGHHATLSKEPFDVVITMRVDDAKDAFSVALHASTTIADAERLRPGEPLADADFGYGTAVAEEPFDREHELFAREGHHEIVWLADSDHRCAEAKRLSADTLECRRHVEKLIGPEGAELGMRGDVRQLLLVFAKLDLRGGRAVEKQRDWIALHFE